MSSLTSEEQQQRINEVRKLVGQLPEKSSVAAYCCDASISRYLRARNWHVKKATKMLKDSLKWRMTYKPEEIQWDEVAHEAETGKIYRSDYEDKQGRTVLIMTPSRENSKSVKSKMKYLVYCMENAIMNMREGEEQMVWLIDFQGFNLSNVSLKVTQETAHVLQSHYPERLGIAILYNPPKFFEPFWKVAKPFLETKTANKVKFAYSDDPNSMKLMEEVFELEKVESSFGGKVETKFEIGKYAQRMREDDKKILSFWGLINITPSNNNNNNHKTIVLENINASAVAAMDTLSLSSSTSSHHMKDQAHEDQDKDKDI